MSALDAVGEVANRRGVLSSGHERLYVAHKHGLAPNLLFRLDETHKRGGKADVQVVGASELRTMKKRIRELERLLGRKTMEVKIIKEAIEVAREKTDLAYAITLRGRFPMSL